MQAFRFLPRCAFPIFIAVTLVLMNLSGCDSSENQRPPSIPKAEDESLLENKGKLKEEENAATKAPKENPKANEEQAQPNQERGDCPRYAPDGAMLECAKGVPIAVSFHYNAETGEFEIKAYHLPKMEKAKILTATAVTLALSLPVEEQYDPPNKKMIRVLPRFETKEEEEAKRAHRFSVVSTLSKGLTKFEASLSPIYVEGQKIPSLVYHYKGEAMDESEDEDSEKDKVDEEEAQPSETSNE